MPLNQAQRKKLRFALSPKTWGLGLGLALLRLLCLLPHDGRLRLGRAIGWLSEKSVRRWRRIATINLALCFPELSAKERDALRKKHFYAVGMGFIEAGIAWWEKSKALDALVRFEGVEHLKQAVAGKRGVLLLTGHFTTLELGGRIMTYVQPSNAAYIYQRHKNPFFDAALRRNREKHSQLSAIPRDNTRAMVRALRDKKVVWYVPDQDFKRQGVFVPFFGVPAMTVSATSHLARMGNALVLPFFLRRLSNGRYLLKILPPLEDFPSGDETADTLRISRLLEQWVRQTPEQYLWIHRRFKTRPPGEKKFY